SLFVFRPSGLLVMIIPPFLFGLALLTSVRRCRRAVPAKPRFRRIKAPRQAGAYESGGQPPHSKWITCELNRRSRVNEIGRCLRPCHPCRTYSRDAPNRRVYGTVRFRCDPSA